MRGPVQDVHPPDSLNALQKNISVLKQLHVPADPRSRVAWPLGRIAAAELSRPSAAGGFTSESVPTAGPISSTLRLGTPLRPSTVASVYSSSFEVLPGRPPTRPLSLPSTEAAEEAEYASRVLKSASMPYLYRPIAALPRSPAVTEVREDEELSYDMGMVSQLPNLTKDTTSDQCYDIAGASYFDLRAVLGPKPSKGARRPRTFCIDQEPESPR